MSTVEAMILIDKKWQIQTEIYEFNYGTKAGRPKIEKITTHVCAPEKKVGKNLQLHYSTARNCCKQLRVFSNKWWRCMQQYSDQILWLRESTPLTDKT